MTGHGSPTTEASPPGKERWPWVLLILALVWTMIERLPLVLNASDHIDSDLAVDGLTLLDATQGHWRWHYPGTPQIGTASVAILAPFAFVTGPTPSTLGIGGILISQLVVISVFVLAWRAFGPRVAAWSLIPLAFTSTGLIWLSGRITGGHLLAVAWHAIAFAGLYANVKQGGVGRAAGLGLWCGLGLWNDSMFLVTVVGLVISGVLAWFLTRRSRTGIAAGLVFLGCLGIGLLPRVVGGRVDPYDAYRETFTTDLRRDLMISHMKILALDCLPRLIVGHRLPGLEAEPGGMTLDGRAKPATRSGGVVPIVVVVLGISLFGVAIAGLMVDREAGPDRAGWAVRWGLLVTSAFVVVGFVVNRNIFNSDNYRYLVFLLVPWSIGFGRLIEKLSRQGRGGLFSATALGLLFAVMFILDARAWYRRLGWIDEHGQPVSRKLDDPILDWLDAHREITHLFGDYWDVYRLSMLTGGRVKGIPSTHYPNRFPEESTRLASRSQVAILARPTLIGEQIRRRAIEEGGEERFRTSNGMILTLDRGKAP